MTKTTILFQGDSITDCGRAACGGAGFDSKGLGPGYPGMIAARLACDRPGVEWDFINRGISGNRVVDLYARWKIDALNLKPDFLSILIGVNDTWHEFGSPNGVEIPRYERFYRELIEWTQRELPSVKLVLLEPFVLCFGAVSDPWLPEIAERARIVRTLAEEYSALFVPLQDLFSEAAKKAPPSHWLVDGVHPTAAGHQLIADAWLRAVSPLLPGKTEESL